jgi:hypothetical protein
MRMTTIAINDQDRTILAFDQASRTWAVLYDGEVKESGDFEPPTGLSDQETLLAAHNRALEIIADHAPDLVALATIYVCRWNLLDALSLRAVQAVIAVAAAALLGPGNVVYVGLAEDGAPEWEGAVAVGLLADARLRARLTKVAGDRLALLEGEM